MASGLVSFLVPAAACQSPTGQPGGPVGPIGTQPSDAGASATAGASDQLEDRLTAALTKYGEPVTDAGRDQALNLLADLVTANGSCEACGPSTILARMLELPASEGELSFEDAARFAISQLLREQLYEDRS